MDFLPEAIEKYTEAHTSAEPAVLEKLNRETHAQILMPQMLSGHVQGRLLAMLSAMIKPKCILEIGTFTGYSTICLSGGLSEGGILHTIDINEELNSIVKRYLKEAGADKKVKVHVGNALEIIPTIKETFDLVFIDADKNNYINYYNLVFDKVRKGGYILADNVLWGGKVLGPKELMDEDTTTIVEYGEMVMKDKRVENVLAPIRDGIMISRKIA
jgi:caffeoyl-CoA O-methyltransferase